jgi:uncharacterized protein
MRTVQAAYLFGSHANGTANDLSDIDIGIVPSGIFTDSEKLELLAHLARAGFDRVDLVSLDGQDLFMDFQVVRQQKLIFKRKQFDASAFFSKTVRLYLDFSPYLEVQQKASIERLKKGERLENGKKRNPKKKTRRP